MELGESDLFNVVRKCKQLSENTAKYIFKKLLFAVKYCHDRKIAHCDLKLENVIFDKKCNPKLIDFGLAHEIVNGGYAKYHQSLGT